MRFHHHNTSNSKHYTPFKLQVSSQERARNSTTSQQPRQHHVTTCGSKHPLISTTGKHQFRAQGPDGGTQSPINHISNYPSI
ncbi:hypothetical protein CEXT_133001 [Caerostris extrusa]|uniref:Uncharacterized protein n=1 Tax=Caerostris extrusa TaxID=172846 RepID=A0AAV4U3N0_CAEEX|nr:hypothetical protein CEXT_133001 [Caerostris extrusa]